MKLKNQNKKNQFISSYHYFFFQEMNVEMKKLQVEN